MTEVVGEWHAHRAASGAEGSHALRPVLLHYAIARREDTSPRLLHVPLGFGEEALVLFSSWQAAQRHSLSDAFGGRWYARECSAGELISLLLGPYEGIDWVLFDPLAGLPETGSAPSGLVSRERFVDYLLG